MDIDYKFYISYGAYMELEHQCLTYTIAGKGTFVNTVDTSSLLLEIKDKLIKEYKNMTLRVLEAGINKDFRLNNVSFSLER